MPHGCHLVSIISKRTWVPLFQMETVSISYDGNEFHYLQIMEPISIIYNGNEFHYLQIMEHMSIISNGNEFHDLQIIQDVVPARGSLGRFCVNGNQFHYL